MCMPGKKIPGDRTIKPFPAYSVKFKDVFDFKEFYTALKEWMLEYGWGDVEEGKDHWETYYAERVAVDGSKEIWARWRLARNPSDAKFLKYYLDLDYHCLGLGPAEIVVEGRKMKVNKGEVEVSVNGVIEEIYKEKFDENPILKEVKLLFAKRIYNKIIEQRKKEFYHEAYELQNYMKQWFKLKRYLPYEENKSFFPSYSWPSHLKE